MIDALPDAWWPVRGRGHHRGARRPRRGGGHRRTRSRRCGVAGPRPRVTGSPTPCTRAAAEPASAAAEALPDLGRRPTSSPRSTTTASATSTGAARPRTTSSRSGSRRAGAGRDARTGGRHRGRRRHGDRGADRGARPHPHAARPGARARPAVAGVAADVAAVLGPRAHRPLRGAVARAGAHRRAAHRAALRRRVRRVPPPAPRAQSPRHPRSRRRARVRRRGARARAHRARPHRPAQRRAAAARRLRVRHGRAARAPARRDDARDVPVDGRLRAPGGRRHADPAPPPHQRGATDARLPPDVLVPGGTFTMGTDTERWAYDNERPAHEVELPAFRIDTTPVTNRAYLEFVESGAYADDTLWTRAGRAWRDEAQLRAPQFWAPAGDGSWTRRRFGRVEALPLDEPVQHVCWYEADAYRAGAGTRLPTEAEWERAAQGASLSAANLWSDDGRPVRSRSRRLAARRRERLRRPPDARRRVGVDEQRLRPVPGVPRVPLPGVLRGVLRRRVQGAARRLVGHAPARGAHHVPQLGLPDPSPDLRRLPLRRATHDAAPHTSADRRESPDVCRHLAALAAPGSTAGRRATCSSTRRTPCRTRRSSPSTRPRGSTTPTAGGSPGTRPPTRRRATTAPSPRSGTTASSSPPRRAIECPTVIAAARLASPGLALDASGNAPFVAGRWAFSLNGAVDGFGSEAGDALRAAITPPRRAARERHRLRSAVRAHPRPHRHAASHRPTRSPR